MTVVLTMIAHATTDAIRKAAFPADEPLDSRGHESAASLAAVFSPLVDVALMAPETRTRQTAAALHLDATADLGLRDIHHGRWAGHTLAAIQAIEPDAVADWIARPDACPHGGESIANLLQRIAPWLSALNNGRSHVVAVTHPAVIRAAVVIAIGASPASFWRIDVGPLCQVRLSGDGARWNLRAIDPSGGRGREIV